MTGVVYIEGVIDETSFVDVIRQVRAQENADEYLVKISSQGGLVSAGYDIYNFLTNLDKPVTTFTTKCYSIATVIFLAGDKRIIPQGTSKAIMIHNPWGTVSGTAEKMEAYASYLKTLEDGFKSFYGEKLGMKEETIQTLLYNETYLNDEEALSFGFATEIQEELKAVAMFDINNNEKKEKESLMNKFFKKANQIMAQLKGAKAELVLQDGTGVELTFPDLEPTDTPEVGQKVQVDGKEAEDKDYIMPDESTIVVSGGVVSEIKPAESKEEQVETEVSDDANAEVIKEVLKWAMEVDNTSFNEGEVITYTYEEVQYPIGAGEFQLSDGKTVITNADGKIVEVKDAETTDEQDNTESEEEAPAPVEAEAKEVISESNTKMLEVMAMAAQKVADLEAKYAALAKSIGSDFQPEIKKESQSTLRATGEDKPVFTFKRK